MATPRLPSLRPGDIIRALLRLGFLFEHQRGSHRYYHHPDCRWATVVMHPREYGPSYVKRMLKESRIGVEQFLANI